MKSRFPVYVISLKRSHERRKLMTKQLTALGIDFKILDAVDGGKISDEDLAKVYTPGSYPLRELKRGEIACTLSHCKVYEEMIRNGDEYAVIMEDDILVSSALPSILAAIEPDQDTLYMFFNILLENCNYKSEREIVDGYMITIPSNVRAIFGTQSYMVSRKTAAKLLDLVIPVKNVLDDWLLYKQAKAFKNLKVLFPFPILHAEFFSDIHVENMNGSLYERIKAFVIRNRVPFLYSAIISKRRIEAETMRRSRATLDGKEVKCTYRIKKTSVLN